MTVFAFHQALELFSMPPDAAWEWWRSANAADEADTAEDCAEWDFCHRLVPLLRLARCAGEAGLPPASAVGQALVKHWRDAGTEQVGYCAQH